MAFLKLVLSLFNELPLAWLWDGVKVKAAESTLRLWKDSGPSKTDFGP